MVKPPDSRSGAETEGAPGPPAEPAAPTVSPPPAPPPVATAEPRPGGRPPARPRRALPDLGSIAVTAGLFGLLAGPVLVAQPGTRLLILAADVVAISLGAWTVWGAFHRFARLDMGIAAILSGGVSLFMYVSYVTDPPPPGGT